MSDLEVSAQFPEKLQFLFNKNRWKILYGGRAATKSWGVARALLILGTQKEMRIVCCREIQKSIDESVHQLLDDQIKALGLQAFYSVQKNVIKGINGTEFTFHGLKFNIDNIKSLEGADICWVEEAQIVSAGSWKKLVPTVRKPGSEIWITFNPELEEDETYQRFVVKPPTNAIVVRLTYKDNPFLSEESKQDMADCLARSKEEFDNVWDGHCKSTVDGAVFGEELRKATAEDRIMHVPYNPAKSVQTFWDLGFSDATAIWFVQKIGFEWRVIDYLEDSQKTLAWYITELQKKPYVYELDNLPHDAEHKTLGAAGKSLQSQAVALGRKVRIIPVTSLTTQINIARTIFSNCYFDIEKCADGIQALRHYQYKVDPDTKQFSKDPLHNWASHGASAFMGFAMMATDKPEHKKPRKDVNYGTNRAKAGTGWMGN